MTSIVKVSPARNIVEQVKWKCKAYSSAFSTVLIVHILISLLSGGGSGMMGYGREFVNYREKFYTLDGLFIFSIIACLIIGWIFASKQLSYDNFSIVTTKRMETVSTVLVLCLLSVFVVISALSTLSISLYINILITNEVFMFPNAMISWASIAVFLLGTLLAGVTGYVLHLLFDFSKVACVVLFIGCVLFIREFTNDFWTIVFGHDALNVIGRTMLYILILWAVAFWINQRREVIRL